jgi:hypothetical protein
MIRAPVVAAAMSAVLVLSSCGGGSGSNNAVGATTESPNSSSSPVGMSRCMRAHGLANFPDPTATAGGEGFPGGVARSITGTLVVNGITFSGPVAAAAEKACARFFTPSGPPPQPTSRERQAMLALARCMRTHGVPSFPDPTFSRAGPKATGPPAAVDPNSPAFKHAVAACGGNQRRLAVSP